MQASSIDHRQRSYPSIAALFAAVALTAGCGGGGDNNPPAPPPGPLTVGVTVDGASGSVMTVQPGSTAMIQVLSGKQLTFASPYGSTWTIAYHDGATASVQTDKLDAKAVTVSGAAGSSVDFKFVNSSNSAESATVTVRLAVDAFDRIAPRVGEKLVWTHTSDTDTSGRDEPLVVREVDAFGSYTITPDRDLYESYDRYNADDGRTYTLKSEVSWCDDTPAVPVVTYPVHAGKTWTYEGDRTCNEMGPMSYTHRSISSVITGFETVTTAAGTYYAARIESTEDYATTGEVPELNGSGTDNSVCWWSTEIGRIIRCDYSGVFEGGPAYEWHDELKSFAQ